MKHCDNKKLLNYNIQSYTYYLIGEKEKRKRSTYKIFLSHFIKYIRALEIESV